MAYQSALTPTIRPGDRNPVVRSHRQIGEMQLPISAQRQRAGRQRQKQIPLRAPLVRPGRLPELMLDLDPVLGNQGQRGLEEVAIGTLIPLELHIQHAPEVSGWSATLRYDPAQLRYVDDSFRPSTFIPGLEALVDSKNGEVIVGGVALGTGAQNSGEGTLGSLSFMVNDRFSGEAWIEIAEISLHQPDGMVIKHQEISRVRFSSGGSGSTAVTDIETKPSSSQLFPNFPNPFNASTALPFQIADAGPVCLEIFDIQGRPVRTLYNGHLAPGHYRFVWNGADERQNPLATGIYLVRLRAGNWSQIRKVALIK